jgi:hypothetical protein
MNLKKRFGIFILLLTLLYQINGVSQCLVHENNFFEYAPVKNQPELTEVTTAICGNGYSQGFSSFAFSNTKSFKGVFCEFIFHDSKRFKTNETKNCGCNNVKVYQYKRGNWDLTNIKLVIKSSYINNTNFVIFRCNDHTKNFTQSYNNPQTFSIIPVKDFEKCMPFTCPKSLRSVSIAYFVFDQAGLAVLIMLSFFASNWQPQKSRGIILIFGLFMEFLIAFVDVIPYLFSVEFAYKYENRVEMLFSFPLQITLGTLIASVILFFLLKFSLELH